MVFAPLPGPIARILEFGDYGVAFFFVLSGFVLTWSSRPGLPLRTFYWRRFARIYPLHFVTLLLAIPVFYSFFPDPDQWWVKPFSFGILLLSFLLLQGWSRDPAILFSGNPAAWTLTVEFFFYAVHPFVQRVLGRFSMRGALWFAAGVCALALTQRVVIIFDPWGAFAQLPWPLLRVNEFLLGMALAWAFRCGWRPRIRPLIPLALIAAWCAAIAILEHYAVTSTAFLAVAGFTPAVMTILFGLMIIATSSRELDGKAGWMRFKPLVALGEWSFAFYLIHATLIYALMNLVGPREMRWMNLLWIAGLLVVATALAGALHVWVERPVEAHLRAWQQGRMDAKAARAAAVVDTAATVAAPAQPNTTDSTDARPTAP